MDEMEQRFKVIEAARSYIGTRYHHEGRVRGAGVDCATLITLSFEQAGVRSPIDLAPYSAQWHIHSEDPLYEKAIVANGGKQVEKPQPGDIALFFQGKQFAHGAIVTQVDPIRIIHAYAPARRVVEGGDTEFAQLVGQEVKFFSAW